MYDKKVNADTLQSSYFGVYYNLSGYNYKGCSHNYVNHIAGGALTVLRDCDLNEISDGKKYMLNDMVKADCNGCKDCSECCRGMGNSIVLDPLDFFTLSNFLHLSFEAMLGSYIELNIVDGIILPNLKMLDTYDEKCVFLNDNGRCSVHSSRPGICRIFPLGRLYENNSFSYILQLKECPNRNKSKIKVSKWIDISNLNENQRFISDWHYFLKNLHAKLLADGSEIFIKRVTMHVLQFFYMEPYETNESFYPQFYKRLEHITSMHL
ncbi:MAG: YkgJ family cysteine cluster protein [Tannerellaceae bacterium]|nr:YkgJ family cysteine cluster protein [Tannerellaceae bacterium]